MDDNIQEVKHFLYQQDRYTQHIEKELYKWKFWWGVMLALFIVTLVGIMSKQKEINNLRTEIRELRQGK